MKQKIIIVLTKKLYFFFVVFGFFFGEKPFLDYVITQKCQILHAKFFFAKLFFSTKANLQPKKGLKNFYLKLIFVYQKNAYHKGFIYENFMISIFLTEIKIIILIVNMPSIIDILI